MPCAIKPYGRFVLLALFVYLRGLLNKPFSIMKKYNFNAGPSMLPREVVEATASAVLDYNGMGLSLMELSLLHCL